MMEKIVKQMKGFPGVVDARKRRRSWMVCLCCSRRLSGLDATLAVLDQERAALEAEQERKRVELTHASAMQALELQRLLLVIQQDLKRARVREGKTAAALREPSLSSLREGGGERERERKCECVCVAKSASKCLAFSQQTKPQESHSYLNEVGPLL